MKKCIGLFLFLFSINLYSQKLDTIIISGELRDNRIVKIEEYHFDNDSIVTMKYHVKSKIFIETFSKKDGKLHGPFERWNLEGQKLEEMYYKNDEMHGIQTQWYTTGEVKVKGSFNLGVGCFEDFYRNGQLKRKSCFKKHWKPVGKEVVYDSLGNLKTELNYETNMYRVFYPDGKVWVETKVESKFQNFPEGEYLEYHPNGVVSMRGTYKIVSSLNPPNITNVKDGVWRLYNEKGEITKTTVYKNGEKVKRSDIK